MMSEDDMAETFIDIMKSNYSKLKDDQAVKILWKEMLKLNRPDSDMDELVDYGFHCPVDLDNYFELLIDKFDDQDKEKFRSIDGKFKAYIITFLYYCTNIFYNYVPVKSNRLATILYLKMITSPGIQNIFFQENMYKVQLSNIISIVKDNSAKESDIIYLLRYVKKFCDHGEMPVDLFDGSINIFIMTLMLNTNKKLSNLSQFTKIQSYALKCYKSIIDKNRSEDKINNLAHIYKSLFRCLMRNVVEGLPNHLTSVNIISLVLKDVLQPEIDDSEFQYLLDGFCMIWSHADFVYHNEAVILINVLNDSNYKQILHRMLKYTQSKNKKTVIKNIMKLTVAIAKNLPPISLGKMGAQYYSVLSSIINLLVDKDPEIAGEVINCFTQMCLLKDNELMDYVLSQIRLSEKFVLISVEVFFLAFTHVADKRWGASMRNYNLLIIMSTVMPVINDFMPQVFQQTLNTIFKGGTPHTIKQALPVLHAFYLKMAVKNENKNGKEVLRIIYNCAMHQDSSSEEFAHHIFKSMLTKSTIDGISYDPKYYYNMFLSAHFEYEPFFIKVQKYIRPQHIGYVIGNLNFREPGVGILLYNLLEYCHYDSVTNLASYFVENFKEMTFHPNLGPLSSAFKKILSNTKQIDENDRSKLKTIYELILNSLVIQITPVDCFESCFKLLNLIREQWGIGKPNDFDLLLISASKKAFLNYNKKGEEHDSILYLNSVCLQLKKLPVGPVLQRLDQFLDHPQCLPRNTLKLLQLLPVLTTLGMMKKRKIAQVYNILSKYLTSKDQIIKLLAFKLMFCFCKEVTIDFTDVINFAFQEMVKADPCLIRPSLGILEELLFRDFIKLDSLMFFKMVYILGCRDLGVYAKNLIKKRFLLSSQNDIYKYYIQTITYAHIYTKLPMYGICDTTVVELVMMTGKIDSSKDLLINLFRSLPVNKKFNLLTDISNIFENIMRGQCKAEPRFFSVLKDLIATFKFMVCDDIDTPPSQAYFANVIKDVANLIVKHDPKFSKDCYYREYDRQIHQCTLTLLKLLFFESEQLSAEIEVPLFDAILHWVDFVKPEIIQYIHIDKGKDYGQYFNKLVSYYGRHKDLHTTRCMDEIEYLF